MEQRPALDAFTRFRPWRRRVEAVFWLLLVSINCSGNAITTWMDANRSGRPPMEAWEPWVWEFSSGMVWLLMLVPAIVWLTWRFPLHRENWRQRLPVYLLSSVPISVLHVLAMFGLRMLAYRLMGEQYRVGSWGSELLYEYLKDIRTLAVIVGFIEGYRFLLRRLQGEAQLLSAPDEGPPVEPIDQPQRLLVRKLGRDFLIATDDIEWAQAAGNYVNLRVKGHDYPLRITMAGLEEKLDSVRFLRVHRSWLVQIGYLVSIKPLEGGEATLEMADGQAVPCSRRYLSSVRQSLGEGIKAVA